MRVDYRAGMISSSQSVSDRLHHVDALRGLAALSVCMFHLTTARPGFLADGSLLKAISQFGYLGVEVFFIISGFIIPVALSKSRYHIGNFPQFLVKRIIRIDPPYFTAAGLSFLLFWLASLYTGTVFSFPPIALLAHIGYLNDLLGLPWMVPIFWTLAIEFQYYIFIAVCFPLLSMPDPKTSLLFCLVFLLTGLLTSYSALFFYYAPLFVFGFLCYLKKEGKINNTLFCLLLCLNFLVVYHKMGLPSAVASALASFLILFWFVKNNILIFLGKISYSIYLIHIPVGTRVVNLLSIKPAFRDHGHWVILLAVIVTLVASYGFYRLIERPSISLSQRIAYKRFTNRKGGQKR